MKGIQPIVRMIRHVIRRVHAEGSVVMVPARLRGVGAVDPSSGSQRG